jgi:hypothetical protein
VYGDLGCRALKQTQGLLDGCQYGQYVLSWAWNWREVSQAWHTAELLQAHSTNHH